MQQWNKNVNTIKTWQFHAGWTCWKAIVFTTICRLSVVAASQAASKWFRWRFPNNLIFIECIFGLTLFGLQGVWEICNCVCIFSLYIIFKPFSNSLYSCFSFSTYSMSVYAVGTRMFCLVLNTFEYFCPLLIPPLVFWMWLANRFFLTLWVTPSVYCLKMIQKVY